MLLLYYRVNFYFVIGLLYSICKVMYIILYGRFYYGNKSLCVCIVIFYKFDDVMVD